MMYVCGVIIDIKMYIIMKPTIDKSKLMKRAWNFFRTHKCTFAIALKIAWDEFKITLHKAMQSWKHANTPVDQHMANACHNYYNERRSYYGD